MVIVLFLGINIVTLSIFLQLDQKLIIMKKILIAVDYNPTAQLVAETGYNLAKAMGAEVVLAHVFAEPSYYAIDYSPIMGFSGMYTDATVALVEDIKKKADEFLQKAVLHFGDDTIKTKLLEGEVTDAILEYNKEYGADLIVMGSHRHTGLESLFVTDEAVQMVKHATTALLIIPTAAK